MNRKQYLLNVVLLLLGFSTTAHAQTIKGKIYGGGQLATVDGDTKVQINSGTIGDGEAFNGGVFGGGLGEPTIVTGNVKVLIGKDGSDKDATGATINGDVYGGSALGNTNCSAEKNATPDKTTNVTLNAGTINGSMYGGALGQKNGVGGATKDVAANVYGPVQVDVNGGIVLRREGDIGGSYSGGIYGCNNWNGSPQTTVDVDIYHHNTAKDGDKYALFAVYGGGNQANYVAGTPNVTVHYCDNSIEYVYGGGNAAHLTHETDDGNGNMVGDGNTNVVIWGCDSIGNVFGGGNGQVQAANVSGNTQVTIHGGKILNVFGGSNTNGMIGGATNVKVLAQNEPDREACRAMEITNVYGGGNMAAGKSGTVNIVCTGEGKIDNVYGGAYGADLTGDITLNIHGGQLTNVFGGNNNSGRINGTIEVNIDWATGSEACGTNSLTNVYGGGNLAPYYAYGYDVVDGVWTERTPDTEASIAYGPIVNLKNGTVSNNVYGGGLGEAAVVTGNPKVNLIGGTVTNDIFGGGDAAPVTGNPLVNANYGTVKDIFAGGRGATAVVTGNPLAYISKNEEKELTVVDVYGGGDAANVEGTAGVKMDKGTVNNIYGGGNAADVTNTSVLINGGDIQWAFAGGHGNKNAVDGEGNPAPTEANVSGNAHLTVHGGTIERVFAGSNSKGTITGDQILTIIKTDDALSELHVKEAYGGGNEADGKAGTFDIGCTGGETEGIGDLFGGAREANITGNVAFTIEGGKINRIFGGNNVSGNVDGSITVNIAEDTEKYACGLNVGYVYGGGQDAAYTPTTPGAYPEVNIVKGSIEHDVFGGGLGASAIVTSNPVVNIQGGTIGNNVFGGGSLAETVGNPTLNVTGGSVTHDVYGGGALANVTGNTAVNLTGGTVGSAYGGALGQKNGINGATSDIAAYVNGNTIVTLNGTQITETGVFGANNLNGTPKGHAFVHVLSTAHRDGQASPYNQEGEGTNSYDVPAVYGGGNLSAYEPADNNDFAEVLIENCSNSIEYVYGGGNAAPVPATKVVIYGANAINHAFAGGNGAGQSTDPDAPNYNPGADVGYLDYTRDEVHKYGSGKASITVYGGTVHNVYGGSNTLGYIRGGTEVSVANEEGACPLNVGNVFGGGNQADINCDVTINCGCSEGADVIYAGANNADVGGGITLNISSGTFGQVFCGNNKGGAVKGKLTLNVDETGCWPVMIGELYGCGNEAAYSVYGYKDDGSCITKPEDMTMEKPYGDPDVNLISFTRIGKVFGAGYGETAVLYGSSNVNVNPIKGKFAGSTVAPPYILDGKDKRVKLSDASTLPYKITRGEGTGNIVIPNEAGSIGDIFGGGNAGAVYGNTNVKIGTKDKNHHISGADQTTNEEVAVTITGDVFGGGEKAIVSGNTNVKVGEKEAMP